jgi:hypothetical protein
MRLWVRPGVRIILSLRIFMGRHEGTEHLKNEVLYQTLNPYLQLNLIPGDKSVKKKRELFSGSRPTSPSSVVLPHNIHVPVQEY